MYVRPSVHTYVRPYIRPPWLGQQYFCLSPQDPNLRPQDFILSLQDPSLGLQPQLPGAQPQASYARPHDLSPRVHDHPQTLDRSLYVASDASFIVTSTYRLFLSDPAAFLRHFYSIVPFSPTVPISPKIQEKCCCLQTMTCKQNKQHAIDSNFLRGKDNSLGKQILKN